MKTRARTVKKASSTVKVPSIDAMWKSTPIELLDRIFQELELKKSCQSIPFVCKAFLQAHKYRLSRVKEWEVEQPITPAKLLFFRTLAPSIEGLTLLDPEGEDTKKKGLVTRLLAVPAPNLHLLKYGCGKADSSVLCGLTKQSQLQSLKLEVGWSPRTSRRIADWQSLKSLQNLEEVHLLGVSMRVPGEWSAAMWKALAGLPRLRELEVGVRDDLMRWIDINPPCADLRSFLRQLPKLKNVRSLTLSNEWTQDSEWSFARGSLFKILSSLTELTALKLDLRLGDDVGSRLELPQLKRLEVFFSEAEATSLHQQYASLASTKLTHLALLGDADPGMGEYDVSVEDLLPPTLASLSHLQHLKLYGYMLTELPPSVAGALSQLTSLSWSYSHITGIPPALSLITTLQDLDLSNNPHLEFDADSFDHLAPLVHLTRLDLDGSCLCSSARDMEAFDDRVPSRVKRTYMWGNMDFQMLIC